MIDDDEVEEVPYAGVGDVLEDELPHQVVRVVRVAVQEGRQQAQELQLLKEEEDNTPINLCSPYCLHGTAG